MDKKDSCYIVDFIEGSRGSFIGDLMFLLLTNDHDTIITVKPIYGDAGFLVRGGRDIPSFDLVLNYPKCDTLVNHNLLLEKYNDWKAIWITADIQELIEIELVNMYKKEGVPTGIPDVAQEFYELNPNLQVPNVDKPQFLKDNHFSLFVSEYINSKLNCTWNNMNEQFDKQYNMLPEEVKGKIFKLNYNDIMHDMPKVLSLLSQLTGKNITPNIVDSYKKYVDNQQLPQKYLDAIHNERQRLLNSTIL